MEALTGSLKVKFLHAVGEPKYNLEANILDVSYPFLGPSLPATVIIQYRLYKINSDEVVYEKTVESRHQARSPADATTRLKRSIEGAVRQNVKSVLDELMTISESDLI